MHYYSYKLNEVLELDAPTYDYLCESMIKARANDDLEMLELIQYPHLKDNSTRQKARRALVRRAETVEELEEKIITADELKFNGIKVGNIADFVKE